MRAGSLLILILTARCGAAADPSDAHKPLDQVGVLALAAGGMESMREVRLVSEWGIKFQPTTEFLDGLKRAGAEDMLIEALRAPSAYKLSGDAGSVPNGAVLGHLQRAAELKQQGMLQATEEELRVSLESDPQNPFLRFALADVLGLRGSWDAAKAEYAQVIQLGLELPEVHDDLGKMSFDNHDLDAAVKEYRKALALDPDYGFAHFNLGSALDGRDNETAIKEYRKGLESKPEDIARLRLAVLLSFSGDHEGSIREFQTALRFNPTSVGAHAGLGAAFADSGDWKSAVKEFQEAVRLAPSESPTRVLLGRALREMGDVKGSEEQFRIALQASPASAEGHLGLGLTLLAEEQPEAAAPELRTALRLGLQDDDAAPAHFNLAMILDDKGDQRGAAAEYRAGLKLRADDPEMHARLGRSLDVGGNQDEAIAELRKSLQLRPDDAMTHNNLGAVLAEKGQNEAAVGEWRTALRLNPNLPDAHYNLGIALEDKGKLSEALEEYRIATSLDPENQQFHQTYEEVARKLKRKP